MSKLKPSPPVIYFFAIPPKIRRFMSFCRSQLSSTVKTFKIINGKLDVTCIWAFFPVKIQLCAVYYDLGVSSEGHVGYL